MSETAETLKRLEQQINKIRRDVGILMAHLNAAPAKAAKATKSRTGYNLFCQDNMKNFSDAGAPKERMTKLGQMWKSLTQDERDEYNTRARAEAAQASAEKAAAAGDATTASEAEAPAKPTKTAPAKAAPAAKARSTKTATSKKTQDIPEDDVPAKPAAKSASKGARKMTIDEE
jgi:hypothetical protein